MAGGTERSALTGVAGVPETLLGDALLSRLPATAAPAPWTVECDAVLWVTRAGPAARRAVPPALPRSRHVAVVVGAVVRYRETPVGPYGEVLGAVGGVQGVRPVGSVAFMAVDSEESLVAGRLHWALPKTLGVLTGPSAEGTVTARGTEGHRWAVTVSPRGRGPALPVRGRTTLRQVSGGSVLTSRLRASGRLRPALVRVGVESDGPLAGWLRPGRHLGAVLTGVRLTLEEPRSSPSARQRLRGRSDPPGAPDRPH